MVLYKLYLLAFVVVVEGYSIRKGEFPSPPTPSEFCLVRNVSCVERPQQQKSCLTTTLTYRSTSLLFAEDSRNLTDVFENLKLWMALKHVPDCWKVIQPFLCSVYLPKCENGVVERSSYELCQRTRKPCRIVAEHENWPDFLNCEALHFQTGCYPTAARQKYNRTSSCMAPLVPTKNPSSVYDSIDGCGLQCQNPLFTVQEHQQTHYFIAVIGTICLISTLFAILTFLIDWKSASKYPTLILFFINLSFFFGCIGWLLQFSGLRESIICRQDGTIRIKEPKMSEGESAWCTIVFFFVYFFSMSGVAWFMMLSYSWYLNFQSLGSRNSSNEVVSKTTYFHIFAWAVPLVLTIIAMTVAEIEGDSLSGICFVGFFNHGIRVGLVLAPVAVALAVGLYYLIKGALFLMKIRRDCPEFVSNRATHRIQFTIIRIVVFTFLLSSFVVVTFIVHIYIFTNDLEWKLSLKNYIVCLAKGGENCTIESRPNVAAIQLNIFIFFASGILMSSWVWTKATYRSWNKFIRSMLSLPIKNSESSNKQKAVAQVFAQPRDDEERQSVSFVTTQDDPIGMNIDLNSGASRPASSIVARSRPRRHRRRPVAQPTQNLRRYSDSDIQSLASYMSRRISGESIKMPESNHRNSFYSRHHAEEGLDIRAWARNAAKRTHRTKIEPTPSPGAVFHKPEYRLRKRHEAALERAARNSEVSSVISDGVSELSSAVFDRNVPLPPIGGSNSAKRSNSVKKPDYSIFTASTFAPGELRRLNDPLNPELPGSVNSERPTNFKRPTMTEVVDFDPDSIDDDVSVLEM